MKGGHLVGETVSSRFEDIVRATIDGTPYTETVHSKEEELLLELKDAIETAQGEIKPLTPEQMANLINIIS